MSLLHVLRAILGTRTPLGPIEDVSPSGDDPEGAQERLLVGTLLLRQRPILWVYRNPDGTAHIRRIECVFGPEAEWDSVETTPEEWISGADQHSWRVGPVGRTRRVRGFRWELSE
jgi:hypothetical protein